MLTLSIVLHQKPKYPLFIKMAKIITLATMLMMAMISITSAYDFLVGGKDGWLQNPKESYNDWAERMRFQVNDTLVFKYKKGEDSVLVVKEVDHDACNAKNPILKLEDGVSTFHFNRSGLFYFISGVADRCARGEKLIVVVMAERKHKPIAPPLSPTPTPPPSNSPSPILPPNMPPTPAPSSNYGRGPPTLGPPTKSSSSALNVSGVTLFMLALVLSHSIHV